MFGDLLGGFKEKQASLQADLEQLSVTESIQDGAITVTARGNGLIENIKIDQDKVDLQDAQQLEDLILEAANRAIMTIQKQQADASKSMMNDILPGGLENLLG